MQAGCDHLWVCVAVTTNGCFLRQVVPRRHTCHDVHFKWESVSTAEVHCQLIEIHGEDVFNPQNQSCKARNMEVGSGDALERREVHPKAFMSQKPLHAITAVWFQQGVVRETSNQLCVQIVTIIFLPMKDLCCLPLPDWEHPLFLDQLVPPSTLPVLCFCELVWIGYVMVKWQISPEMSVVQYDKQSFLTLTTFSAVWASFLVMLSLCRRLGIWASSTPWFCHRRVHHLQLCKWGREKAPVKVF